MGVEKLVRPLSSSLPQVLTASPVLHIPRQTTELVLEPTPAATCMGRFYEALTAAIHGGEVTTFLGEYTADYLFDLRVLLDRSLQPDVVDAQRNRLLESKASRRSMSCQLSESQINSYEEAQHNKPYPTVSYIFYRHCFDGIKSRWKGPEAAIYRKLARSTSYSVVLPLSVITHLRDSADERFAAHSRDEALEVRSSFFSSLINDPEEAFVRIGLDPADYHFLDYITADNLTVNRTNVRPFPIRYVEPAQANDVPF